MIKSNSMQKSSNKPPNVFVVPALKSPTKQIFGHCSSSHNSLNLPRYAKNSSVLALLQYGRYTLIKHNSDFFKNTLKPIIEPSQFKRSALTICLKTHNVTYHNNIGEFKIIFRVKTMFDRTYSETITLRKISGP